MSPCSPRSKVFSVPSSTRRTHYWVTFAGLAVAVSSYTLMQSLTIPVLSEIETVFDTDQNTVTWVLTAYLLSASIFTPNSSTSRGA